MKEDNVKLPDPVAYREWSTKYRCWEVSDKDDLPAGADTKRMEPLYRLSDLEAYADARVREATTALYEASNMVRYALELGLEYVKYDLETEKQMYKGFEHCSDIKSIEEDIQTIQAALEKIRNMKHV